MKKCEVELQEVEEYMSKSQEQKSQELEEEVQIEISQEIEMKITYKQIASMINRSEANIKYMKKHNPQQLEIIKLGCIEKLKM